MKEFKTSVTDKQKFDNALELLQKSSKLFDMASKVFSDIGIELYNSSRPIEFHALDKNKPNVFVASGVMQIAKINGTKVAKGTTFYAQGDEGYISTVVNGIDFHELV